MNELFYSTAFTVQEGNLEALTEHNVLNKRTFETA